MKRYWFMFDITEDSLVIFPEYCGLGFGCGVTAYDLEDARRLLRERIFRDAPFPKEMEIVEDIDVSTLDHAHVLPNIGVSSRRGIWFPVID